MAAGLVGFSSWASPLRKPSIRLRLAVPHCVSLCGRRAELSVPALSTRQAVACSSASPTARCARASSAPSLTRHPMSPRDGAAVLEHICLELPVKVHQVQYKTKCGAQHQCILLNVDSTTRSENYLTWWLFGATGTSSRLGLAGACPCGMLKLCAGDLVATCSCWSCYSFSQWATRRALRCRSRASVCGGDLVNLPCRAPRCAQRSSRQTSGKLRQTKTECRGRVAQISPRFARSHLEDGGPCVTRRLSASVRSHSRSSRAVASTDRFEAIAFRYDRFLTQGSAPCTLELVFSLQPVAPEREQVLGIPCVVVH